MLLCFDHNSFSLIECLLRVIFCHEVAAFLVQLIHLGSTYKLNRSIEPHYVIEPGKLSTIMTMVKWLTL